MICWFALKSTAVNEMCRVDLQQLRTFGITSKYTRQINLEYCGVSVSEKYTAALKCYTHVAKTLPVNFEITAHRLWEVAMSVILSAKCLIT